MEQHHGTKILGFSLYLFVIVASLASLDLKAQVEYYKISNKSMFLRNVSERLGMNYFSFWEGPSLEDGQTGRNEIARPQDTGLSLFNLVSIKYRINSSYNVDIQNRIEHIHTQEPEWRFQGIRAGLSGTLLKGESWNISGAVNTDVPELNGSDARDRTVLFNPGLFAGLNWNLSPKWSLYAILSPRLFFYQDDQAVEEQWLLAGRDPGEKPRAIIQASPTINYAFNDTIGIRSGIDLQFRQFVESSPTYLKRWPSSWTFGPTINISKMLNTYVFVQSWPFDGKGLTRETSSLGMWLSGVLF